MCLQMTLNEYFGAQSGILGTMWPQTSSELNCSKEVIQRNESNFTLRSATFININI